MRRWAMLGVLGLLLTGGARAAAVYEEHFEDGIGGWVLPGQDGQLSTQSKVAHQGQALESSYTLGQGLHVLAAPVETGAGTRSLHFWLRTSTAAVIYVVVAKKNEAGYGTYVLSEPNTWQEVWVSYQRLRLGKDHPDPDGKLDPEDIAYVGVADASAMLKAKGVGGPDRRTLWLDDVSLDTDEAPDAYSATGKLPFTLDKFDLARPLSWLAVDGELTHDLKQGQMVWSYEGGAPPDHLTAMMGALGRLPAQGATHLVMTLQSQRDMQLAVAFQEEARGQHAECRYVAVVQVPKTDAPTTIAVPLSDLKLDTSNGGHDDNGRLDLDQCEGLLLGDLDAITGQNPGPNVLRFEELQLVGK